MDTKSLKNSYLKFTLIGTMSLLAAACARENPSFSLLSDAESFKQSASNINSKVDILWVVDNSGSMSPFQQRLVTNFNAFMKNFVTKGYDYQIAVTTSDAYLADPRFGYNYPKFAQFKDGLTKHTKAFVVNPFTLNPYSSTPTIADPIGAFVINATQGDQGSGDERAFSSLKTALDSNYNTGFLRPDSFLAVIILSDEDDFSSPTRAETGQQNYNDPTLETVDSYVSYLDQKTGSTSAATRRYNVSAVAVIDEACRAAHVKEAGSTLIGKRYMDLVNKTGGVLGSICDASYATSLDNIQNRILQLQTQFYLSRIPVVSTIVVTVDGQTVPKDATNGWTYVASTNSIMFGTNALPPAGASIRVDFDPAEIK